MRADSEPWLVPMRIARPRSLHFSTSGENFCTAGSGTVMVSQLRADRAPCLVPMRIARLRSLHFGENFCEKRL